MTSSDAHTRHQAIAVGFFAAVAYRNLKAVTTLVCLHSTIEALDGVYDWEQDQPLLAFEAQDRADGHEPLMLGIKSAILIAAAINVVSKHGDRYVDALHDAYEFQSRALKREQKPTDRDRDR